MTQFLAARDVKIYVNLMRGQIRNKRNKPELVDLQYGFYVTTGGFGYVLDDLATWHSHMTLTPNGVIALAGQGFFVDIGQRNIEDKNKANILTKSLICIQVSWLVIQCIARAAAGYPLTLLEIHAMVHVGCAFCMYTLWWNKPFDVIEPTLISRSESSEYSGLLALMPLEHEFDLEARSALEYFRFTTDSTDRQVFDHGGMGRGRPGQTASNQSFAVQSPLPMDKARQGHGLQDLSPVRYLSCGMGMAPLPEEHLSGQQNTWFETGSKKRKLMELSAAALKSMLASMSPQAFDQYTRKLTTDFKSSLFGLGLTDGLRESFAPTTFLDNTSQVLPEADYFATGGVTLLVLVGILYGGVHLAAWNFQFPTQLESILWKVACFVAILTPASVEIALQITGILTATKCRLPWLAFGPIVLIFLSSRMFLVVESFISLRHVPIGVYAEVPWVQSIPHVWVWDQDCPKEGLPGVIIEHCPFLISRELLRGLAWHVYSNKQRNDAKIIKSDNLA